MGRCLLESLELQELQPAPETPLLAPINTTAKRNHAWQEPGYLATPGAEPGEGHEDAGKLGVGQANTRASGPRPVFPVWVALLKCPGRGRHDPTGPMWKPHEKGAPFI